MITTNSKLSLLLVAFFVVALFCLVVPSSCDPQTVFTIYRICDNTPDPKFCRKTLFGNIKNATTSLPDLTRITMALARKFVTFVRNNIQTLQDKSSKDPKVQKYYQNGKEEFELISIYLGNGQGYSDRGMFQQMNIYVLECARHLKALDSIFKNFQSMETAIKLTRVFTSALAIEVAIMPK